MASEKLGLQVGYARACITPQEPTPLSGFGSNRTRISERVTDELYATCIALTDEYDNTVLLIACDQQRPQEEIIAFLRESVHGATGIAQDKIIITASHSHSTPDLYMLDMPCIPRYHELLKKQFAQAAVEALADRQPATVEVGSIDTERLNFVKHYKQANGCFVGDNFGDAAASPIVDHASKVYGKMHVVKFLREGRKDIVMANFRSHPTMTGGVHKKDVSADFVGPYRDAMEKQYPCDFVFIQGACGNINPRSRLAQENRTRNYVAYGGLLAEATLNCLEKNMHPVPAGKIQSRQINYMAKVNHDYDSKLDQAREIINYWNASGYDWIGCKKLCDQYDFSSVYHAMAVRRRVEMAEEEPVELDVVTVGDQLAFVSAPGELWDSVSVVMEERSPFPMSLTVGYANGDRKYFPHGVGLTYRSYESDYATVAPGTADKIIDLWVETLEEFYQNAK